MAQAVEADQHADRVVRVVTRPFLLGAGSVPTPNHPQLARCRPLAFDTADLE